MRSRDTIFALSSGAPPAGIAILRLSGDGVRFGFETLLGYVPEPRFAELATLQDADGEPIDRGIVLFFPAPASFTGEDVGELQLHGGRAVVAAALAALAALPGFRAAEPGEFTRRAFENGRADLTEVEGLADLIAAETQMQRRLALGQAGGTLRRRYEDWRERLIRARALVEAELDFSDEDDVPDAISRAADTEALGVAEEIGEHLSDRGFGERVRSGFEVVLLGAPNVGKSSLLNALARREVAIVTPEAGTTRDAIEVHLDLNGFAVTLVDTAGLRETESVVEREGIARARRRGAAADLVLVLEDGEAAPPVLGDAAVPVLHVRTKADLGLTDSDSKRDVVPLSAKTGEGLDRLTVRIAESLGLLRPPPDGLVTRERQRRELQATETALRAAVTEGAPELKAEHLRRAADALGRLTGRIEVDDWLGVIFSEFCIGK